MKKAITSSCFLVAVFLCNYLQAQQAAICGTMANLQQQLNNNPQIQARYDNYLDKLRQLQTTNASRADRSYSTVYIPVVFHIVHNGDALGTGENITDEQVLSQIDAMNKCFNAEDPDLINVPSVFRNLVANSNIKFCVALFDPNGNPTTGVVRHQFSQVTWDSMPQIDALLKPSTIWDNTRYLNIWTVRMGGALAGEGVLAYSSFPFIGSPDADGIVVRYNCIGTTGTLMNGYVKGKTVAHEAGHYFGLFHVWGDDNGKCSGDIGGGEDYVGDTPDAADANFGCPTFPHITCNNGPNGDMFMNYMDYTSDDCRNMFTVGQNDNMHLAMNTYRSDIKNVSTECFFTMDGQLEHIDFPLDTICSLNFRPVVTIKNLGLNPITSGRIYYEVDGSAPLSQNWSGLLNTADIAQVVLPVLGTSQGRHILVISFGNINGHINDDNSVDDTQTDTFYAYNGGAAAGIPFTEGFEGNFPPTSWSVSNPNNDGITWVQNTNSGGYGLSLNSVSINNLGYTSNPNKRKDALITDGYELLNVDYPEFKFDVAYARYNANRYDSLTLFYSVDCGSHWVKVWSQKGSDLATAPDITTAFIPDATQWKTVTVPLVNLAGQSKVIFKFENVTGWGNTLYLDNINLQNNPALSIHEVQRLDVKVFPNPASQMVAVRLPFGHPFKQMQLINNLGQVVYKSEIPDNALIFPVDNFANGLYVIQLSGSEVSQTEKLLIAK